MSNKERWLSSVALLISLLPFILVAGSMQLLPDYITIPNLRFEEEEILLEKYKYLYLGLFGLAPAVLAVTARILRTRKLVERNFMFMTIAAISLGIVFLLVSVYGVIYHIVSYKIDLLKSFDFYGGATVLISLILGLMSNFFPYLRRNGILGLRNKYTMADNRIWLKVHYAAANVYMSVFYTLAVFSSALSIFLDFRFGWIHIILWVIAVAALLLWGRLYSKLLGKRFPTQNEEAK